MNITSRKLLTTSIIVALAVSFSNQLTGQVKKFSKKEKQKINTTLIFDLLINHELTERNYNLSLLYDYTPNLNTDEISSVVLNSRLGGQEESVEFIYIKKLLTKINYTVDRDEGNGPILFRYKINYQKKKPLILLLKDKPKYKFVYEKGLLQQVLVHRKGLKTHILKFIYNESEDGVSIRYNRIKNGRIIKGNKFYDKKITWDHEFRLTSLEIDRYKTHKIVYNDINATASLSFADALGDKASTKLTYDIDERGNWIVQKIGKTTIKRIINYITK